MVFCVEDDDSIRQLEVYALQNSGYTVLGLANAKALWSELLEKKPELIILDIMLPDEDGISVLKKLRENASTAEIPVLMASAKGSEFDKVLGLDSGADDYIAKPFGMMELVARVKALLRRTSTSKEDVLQSGEISINIIQHKVYVNNEEIVLTRKEFSLLQMLMERPEEVFTRETLLAKIWGYNFDGETRTLDVHMRTLRTKLGKAGTQLQTVRGVGYRMSTKAE